MIAKLICRWFGHLRGKRVSLMSGKATFQCPRCGAQWIRKVKA
jgi:predicted RNA-binding Zn-ribbon protein involved in translation (DUF1610 family)